VSRLGINALQKREVSLDFLRGLVIVLMILVNNPGGSEYFSVLQHSAWNGLTLADMVMPLFIFVMGVTIPYSFSRRLAKEGKKKLLIHIASRTLILFVLGLVVNGFPYYNLETLRIMGVLQRLALCYLLASLTFLFLKAKWRIILNVLIPITYWFSGNLPAQLDRLVFGSSHLLNWNGSDPEGILSTISAFATVLIGVIVGEYLLSKKEKAKPQIFMLLSLSGLLMGAGLIWSIWLPLNKVLWSSSYMVLTAGISLMAFVFCYALKTYSITKPFTLLGLNAIFIYVLSEILNLTLIYSGIKNVLFESLSGWAGPLNGSFLYALGYLGLLWILAAVMYKKKLFIKI
jgi:predicted acyltransferase